MRAILSAMTLTATVVSVGVVIVLGHDLFYTDTYASPDANPGKAACGILAGLAVATLNGYLFLRLGNRDD